MTGGIEEFRIAFGQQAIDDLHRRIDATRWPDVGWDTLPKNIELIEKKKLELLTQKLVQQ